MTGMAAARRALPNQQVANPIFQATVSPISTDTTSRFLLMTSLPNRRHSSNISYASHYEVREDGYLKPASRYASRSEPLRLPYF